MVTWYWHHVECRNRFTYRDDINLSYLNIKSSFSPWHGVQTTNRYKEYKDAYKIALPPRYRLLKNTGSVDELFVYDFARNFFTSKVFSSFEGPCLEFMSKSQPDRQVLGYRAFKFKVGDKVMVWKVISRENNEILMKWEMGNLSGTTWFYIPSDENVLVFGSSFLVPRENYTEEKQFKVNQKSFTLMLLELYQMNFQVEPKLKV